VNTEITDFVVDRSIYGGATRMFNTVETKVLTGSQSLSPSFAWMNIEINIEQEIKNIYRIDIKMH
jgi:hypothetical protein